VGNANSGNKNFIPVGVSPTLKEQRELQVEIKATLNKINDLKDAGVAKHTAAANAIKRAKCKRETFNQRSQRVNALFSASVSSEDIFEFVQALVRQAKDGNLDAIRIILDRLAGKAPQSLDVTSGGERIDSTIELVLDVSKGPSMLEGDAKVIHEDSDNQAKSLPAVGSPAPNAKA
jgi:hypothetical protein